jgi:hypothetical protein
MGKSAMKVQNTFRMPIAPKFKLTGSMKVVRNDATRLELRDWSWTLLALFAAPMAVIGLMAWGYVRAGQTVGAVVLGGMALLLLIPVAHFCRLMLIRLDRAAGTARVVEIGLTGMRSHRHPLQGLTGATTEVRIIKPNRAGHVGELRWRKRRPDIRAHRPLLIYADGHRVPLFDRFGAEDRASVAAGAVNGWAQRQDG